MKRLTIFFGLMFILPVMVFGQYQTFVFDDCYTGGEDGGVSGAKAGLEKKVKQRAIAQAGQTIRTTAKMTTSATNTKSANNSEEIISEKYFDETIIESQGRIKTEQKAGTEKKELVGNVIKYCAVYTVSVDTGAISAYFRKLEAEKIAAEKRRLEEENKRIAEQNAKTAAEKELVETQAEIAALAAKLQAAQEKANAAQNKLGGENTANASVSTSSNSSITTANKTINGIECVLVKAGKFMMGKTETDSGHQVTLTKDYFISKYEITQEQYEKVMGNNPSITKGEKLPVTNVTWAKADDFCAKINARLPTEAEWEFAASGGNNSKGYKYSGNDNLNRVGWFSENSSKLQTVGQKQPNELGIYDMSGNVWEWCNDYYGSYPKTAVKDPKGPNSGSSRVIRGGSYRGELSCRVSYRSSSTPLFSPYTPSYKLRSYCGFRVVFDVE